MRVGFTTMNTADDVPPDALASALVQRGYSSWWVGEHSHIPASRRTPYPGGSEMPDQYRRMMDPFLSLLAAATAQPTLRIGLGVALVLEHDLMDLAKSIATLDVLTSGRLTVGVGMGWNEEQLANHRPDIPWRRRYRAVEEAVAALRRLWTDELAEFHGEYFDFDPVWMFPKPHQRPHPPIVVGAAGPLGQEHTIRWGDGWLPMDASLGKVARRIGKFREAAATAGRDDIPIIMTTYGDPTAETMHAYRELGIVEVVVGANRSGWDDPTSTVPYLDRYAPLIPELA